MHKNRLKFTTKFISTLLAPNTAQRITYYYDTQVRGLGIYLTRNKVKTYFVYRRVEGKPQRIILGRADEITLEQAREKALNVHSQIASGINPQDKKRAIRQEITLGELWSLYWERHATPFRACRRNDESLYRLYFSPWADRKLSSINTNDIRDLHHRIGRDVGTVRANHAHALIRLMFNKAIEWGWTKPKRL